MALESATYINDLNAANPASTDGLAQADDHFRLIKGAVKSTFPNIAGAVTLTHTELNYLSGATSGLQSQIDNLSTTKGVKEGSSSIVTTGAVNAGSITSGFGTIDTGTSSITGGAMSSSGTVTMTAGAADWAFTVSGNNLIISYDGTSKMKLDTAGNLTVVGDVTAFGTI